MNLTKIGADLEYCRASIGKRFLNYIIDSSVYSSLILYVGTTFGILSSSESSIINTIINEFTSMFGYGLIMFLTETILGGKSLGKLITQTKAVNLDGSDMNYQQAFIRNIIRIVPFNPLSALEDPPIPWHDRWSRTMVIDEKMVYTIEKDRESTVID